MTMLIRKFHRPMNENTGEPESGAPQQSPHLANRSSVEEEIAAKVHAEVSPDLHAFNEDTGEIIPNEPAKDEQPPAQDAYQEPSELAVEGEPEPEAKPEPEPAPAAPKMVSIVVDGQPVEVEESRILEAGKRTLQKDHAADRRLQEATQARKQAEELLRQAQRLSNPDTALNEPAPSQDAPQQHQQATQGIDPQALDTYLENKLYMRDAQKAADSFRKEFPDIAADPHLMGMAASLETQRLSTATALGESFGDPYEAYRKHGEAVREWMRMLSGKGPVVNMADKAEKKRTILTVPAASARPAPPAPPREPTVSEIIEAERKARMGRPVVKR
jgi:hypothetical protein